MTENNNDKNLSMNPSDTHTSSKKTAILPNFLGSYSHGLDGKGRIIIPAGYRGELGESFVIGPTKDISAIALYPLSTWEEIAEYLEKIRTSPMASKSEIQLYLNQFAKYVFLNSESDAQGRILIPAKMRSRFLGEAKELEISGSFDHIRIVASTAAAQEDASFDDKRLDIMDNIAELLTL
ncbi:MAG: hypothetical protein GX786_03085 [Clostridiales bacterium]|nr:hypothetical protein [Clostridiales bacterium]